MSNQNLNPLSRLLDIDFPEINRSNWNTSYDVAFTADVGYVKPVFVDRVMAGTRCQLDFDSASFANSTIAPLYGRYKVKYLAFWAPDRLYMSDWLTGEKMVDDDYPYPYIKVFPYQRFAQSGGQNSNFASVTASGQQYVPPTSLAEYLGIYPAFATSGYWRRSSVDDPGLPVKNAFSLLAFWDAYRSFFVNPQEEYFPVRTQSAEIDVGLAGQMLTPVNTYCKVSQLDEFFRAIKRADSDAERDVLNIFNTIMGFNPVTCPRRVYQINQDVNYTNPSQVIASPDNAYFSVNYHYGLPLGTYLADPYTSFISNDNVEVERSKSKVLVNNNEFTMEQWYIASRIQSKIRKNLYQFDDFAQWIDTNFGVKPSTTLTKPMFLGAFMSDIIFNDAISTVQQTDNEDGSNYLEQNKNLGSRAGYGVGYKGDRENFFDFTAKEPGTVMIVQQIIPEVFYFEGSDKIHEKLNFNEEFNPIFDALGFQDLEKADMNLVPHLALDSTGTFVNQAISSNSSLPGVTDFTSYNSAVAQQPYGFEHMAKHNRLMGQMTQDNYYQSWSLARSFNYVRGANKAGFNTYPQDSMQLYSSYIIPEMYNNIFANTQNIDNFQFYLSFDYKKYQPVSKQFLSFY